MLPAWILPTSKSLRGLYRHHSTRNAYIVYDHSCQWYLNLAFFSKWILGDGQYEPSVSDDDFVGSFLLSSWLCKPHAIWFCYSSPEPFLLPPANWHLPSKKRVHQRRNHRLCSLMISLLSPSKKEGWLPWTGSKIIFTCERVARNRKPSDFDRRVNLPLERNTFQIDKGHFLLKKVRGTISSQPPVRW